MIEWIKGLRSLADAAQGMIGGKMVFVGSSDVEIAHTIGLSKCLRKSASICVCCKIISL